MNVIAYTDRFFQIEERLDLFHEKLNGRPWWDAVRHDVYNYLYRRQFAIRASVVKPPQLSARARALAIRVALKARLLSQTHLCRHDILVFRAPRQRRGERAWDAAVDHLAAICPGRKLTIDTFPHYYHRRTALRTGSIEVRPKILDVLQAAIESDIGIHVEPNELSTVILPRISAFLRDRIDYLRLFDRVRPKLVLLSQNGIEKAMFSAANELRIPLLETQHGLINRSHPAYSYSRRIDYRNLDTFPTHFLTFSTYWTESCYYPVANCIAIGNDNFFVPRTLPDPDRGDILFISADLYHSALVPWVKAVAERLPARSIKYKLHPNQHEHIDNIRCEFSFLRNVEVIAGSVAARDLMFRTSCVVLIQSTVAYEALQAGRRLCLIPEMNYQIHSDLFDLPGVTVTMTFDELVKTISSDVVSTESVNFFDRFDEARAANILRQVLDRSNSANESVSMFR
jgi:hypothetical protein